MQRELKFYRAQEAKVDSMTTERQDHSHNKAKFHWQLGKLRDLHDEIIKKCRVKTTVNANQPALIRRINQFRQNPTVN